MNLKNYIVEKAREIDIDIIGFTDKVDYTELSDILKTRREKNYETEFEERDIEKRINPKFLLDTVESIIVIGVPYFSNTNLDCINIEDREETKSDMTCGCISKSAIGTDYHKIVMDKMEKLVIEIKKEKDFDYKIGVDTTPLIDRALAEQAGIGWYGKNSLIINDKFGSFISLGYILIDFKIDSDELINQKCETCILCIKSCPVGAIKKGYELNAKRCISYLTQTKDEIPYNLRDKMENKVYGCDICQLVCPKNKAIIKNKGFKKDETVVEYLNIEEILHMSNREFKEKYGETAFSWRGKNIIKRNCIIALGNSADKSNIELLKRELYDQSSMIRKYSAWAILKLDSNIGKIVLEEHVKIEKDRDVLDEINKLKSYFKLNDE